MEPLPDFKPNLSSDKIIVISGLLLSIPVAILFHSLTCSNLQLHRLRKEISAFIGTLLLLWCYRWDSIHLFLQWLVSYGMFVILPLSKLGRYTFTFCFSHVLLTNAYKFWYQYGEFPLDYHCTLMLGTMKMTSFAFALQDAKEPTGRLRPHQLTQAIRSEVGLADHFCYYFSFIGIIFGPFIFYNYHKDFMENKPVGSSPLYKRACLTLLYGVSFAILHLLALPSYDVTVNTDPEVLSGGFLYRQWILYVTMFIARCKYYFVWLSAESVCMFAGMGDPVENAAELITNPNQSITAAVNPMKIELATSLKQFIDNWNIFTAKWLRFAVYDRVPKSKALLTFIVSAVWHGFYPGYLLMFIPLAFYSVLGQKLHKVVRPIFQRTKFHTLVYAVITWVGTTITVYFNGTAFQLLYLSEIIKVQSKLYFFPHIVVLLLFIIIPPPASTRKQQDMNGNKNRDEVSNETLNGISSREAHVKSN